MTMKMYKAPAIETVELDVIDVIATSGEEGIDTSAYGLKSTTLSGDAITNTNKGGEWQSNWN